MRISHICALLLASGPAFALTPDDITSATYDGGSLPEGQSGVTVKLQVLLDRAGVSPGVIDGYKGGMSESALRGFEEREGFPVDGTLDKDVWAALGADSAAPILTSYTVTEEDAANLTDKIPDNVAKKAKLDQLGYTRVSEKLAERFHMDEDFLRALNEGASFAPGSTLMVTDPGARLEGTADRVEIRKSDRRAVAFDAAGNMLTSYPVAIGSQETPSPEGQVEVVAVAMDPTYSYRPDTNFVADGVEEALTLPPGPNGPVGTVWIDLSKPTYGLHGTDTPAKLFENDSHGCVRFSNWDVEELAFLVSQGVSVEFVE
ncbi:L,D-transpeptidase [Sulfitobacter sp. S190]|uniref:L,D-transpeptidase family protein n=1 Tax=Sulfitobacter sp. S190 TaxID=2867022 RepID=UPI0021A2D12A|nr:L,D-transpeptidase [Sulfitobacter sp. S190]UWR21162.1 L,D-transpeptidase [Sulfitobacter sp. S190]